MSKGPASIPESLFNPGSIAIFGASGNQTKSGSGYLKALLDVGRPGRLYPIHPKETEIQGLKAYASIKDCPGPVDYAIFCVPAHRVPDLVKDCGAAGVKAIQLFTAGFKETGEPEGIELEKQMLRIARDHGIRVIGPNCIGIYCPESRIPYGMAASPMEPGNVGFLSQSGGHAGRLISGGFLQGLRFSKVVSYGNGCDLNAVDFLKCFESDRETRVIGAYLEGMEEARPFFSLVKQISKKKPVVIWKGGQTDQGGRTLLSHTGSLAGPFKLWEDAIRQSGAVKVGDLEELTDTLLTLSRIPNLKENRLVITTGLMGGGGGASVAGTDICIQEGLDVIPFTPELQKQISDLLPRKAGTILTNPIDTGSAMSLTALTRIIRLVIEDSGCNIIALHEIFERMAEVFGEERFFAFFADLLDLSKKSNTPIVLIWPPEASTAAGISLRLKLIENGLTVFASLRRAARAISNGIHYWQGIETSR